MQREAEKECNKIKRQNAKLRTASIFGKSIKNPINKVNVKIVTSRKQYLRWLSTTTFKREKQFRNGAIPI